MPYIYKITNQKNGKSYIGKTLDTVESRWKEHCKECQRKGREQRPLYSAMKKYGIENFSVEEIESCTPENLSEREIFWVNFYDTYRNGYNATFGGDGVHYIDYGSVYEAFRMYDENATKTADAINIDRHTVLKVVKALNGNTHHDNPWQKRRVNMFSRDGNYIRTFSSTRDAGRFIADELGLNPDSIRAYASHITAVCSGKRRSCAGYVWEYA